MIGEVKISPRKKRVKPEYEVGDYVVYGSQGVCRVEEITRLTMPDSNEKNHYYCLVPVDSKNSRIYAIVGQKKVTMRRIITEKEAMELIDNIEDIPVIEIKSEKLREEQYKTALRTCDCKEWVSVIKTLYVRNIERQKNGKKATTTDERYMKEAKRSLYTELSIVLNRDKEDIEDFITKRVAENNGIG
ncbi:MAG: CarD family transcriptional regulator [Lachnospiraceae bacterium]|nr:CarD family transcriptional regulator [Lachnospiraceae bacterium]